MDMTSQAEVLVLAAQNHTYEAIKKVLSKEGYISTHIRNRKTLLDITRVSRPIAVVADLEITQYTASSILKDAHRHQKGIPVIFIGDDLNVSMAIALIHQGASDYLPRNQLSRLAQSLIDLLKREKIELKRRSEVKRLRDTVKKLQLFRMLIDQSTDGIEIVDPNTMKFIDVNTAECVNLGYSKDELLQMTVLDIDSYFRKSDDHERSVISRKLEESGLVRFEGIHQRKDGSEFPVELSTQLITLDKPYYLTIARDISERKVSEAEMLRLNNVLKTLNEATNNLIQADNETELMHKTCRILVKNGEYSLAWIGMAEEHGNKNIIPIAISENGNKYVDALNLSWEYPPGSEGPSGLAIRTGLIQRIENINSDPRCSPWRELANTYGYASCVVLPLKNKLNVFGCIAIYSKDINAFHDNEINLLEKIANNLAFGIIHLRMRNERDQAIKERIDSTSRLRKSLEDTVQAVATVIELRDLYTAGHQKRVAQLATAIANEMHLNEDRVHGIHIAGIVHDIGKIHIPAEILSKPAKLTEIEYNLVKTHSQAGYDILKGIEFPWPIAQTVLQHHERINGTGYPQGLKGDNIILEARILAVADVIDSMFSHRPYRPGMDIVPALDEIQKNRGVLYDDKVVDACLKLFLENKFSFSETQNTHFSALT